MSFSIEIKGIEDVIKSFGDTEKKAIVEIDKIIGAEVENMAKVSKQLAPVYLGELKNKISAKKIENLRWSFISAAPYSAYVEFGTKKKVEIPKGYEELASQSRGGSSGRFIDLYHAILDWVRKKKIVTGRQRGSTKAEREEVAAWNIAMKIAKNGIDATHFYTRAIDSRLPTLYRELKKAVK